MTTTGPPRRSWAAVFDPLIRAAWERAEALRVATAPTPGVVLPDGVVWGVRPDGAWTFTAPEPPEGEAWRDVAGSFAIWKSPA